jgi:hypothetical protein
MICFENVSKCLIVCLDILGKYTFRIIPRLVVVILHLMKHSFVLMLTTALLGNKMDIICGFGMRDTWLVAEIQIYWTVKTHYPSSEKLETSAKRVT